MDNTMISKLDEQRINELLAYTPDYRDDNIRTLFMQKAVKKRISVRWMILAAAIAIVFVGASGVAISDYIIRTSNKSSEHLGLVGFPSLEIAFSLEDAMHINASQTQGDYTITLMSVSSGNDIPDHRLNIAGGGVSGDSIYALVAINRVDGSPFRSVVDEDGSDFFHVSPFINGFQPGLVNSTKLARFGAIDVVDGVLYYLIECDDLSVFADHGVYIGVMSGAVVDFDAFFLDEVTGEVIPNPDFDGVNIIFEIPFDVTLADPVRAQAILSGG